MRHFLPVHLTAQVTRFRTAELYSSRTEEGWKAVRAPQLEPLPEPPREGRRLRPGVRYRPQLGLPEVTARAPTGRQTAADAPRLRSGDPRAAPAPPPRPLPRTLREEKGPAAGAGRCRDWPSFAGSPLLRGRASSRGPVAVPGGAGPGPGSRVEGDDGSRPSAPGLPPAAPLPFRLKKDMVPGRGRGGRWGGGKKGREGARAASRAPYEWDSFLRPPPPLPPPLPPAEAPAAAMLSTTAPLPLPGSRRPARHDGMRPRPPPHSTWPPRRRADQPIRESGRPSWMRARSSQASTGRPSLIRARDAGRSEARSAILDEGRRARRSCFAGAPAIWARPVGEGWRPALRAGDSERGTGGSGTAGPARAEVPCEAPWRPLRRGPKMSPLATGPAAEETWQPDRPHLCPSASAGCVDFAVPMEAATSRGSPSEQGPGPCRQKPPSPPRVGYMVTLVGAFMWCQKRGRASRGSAIPSQTARLLLQRNQKTLPGSVAPVRMWGRCTGARKRSAWSVSSVCMLNPATEILLMILPRHIFSFLSYKGRL